MQQKHYLKLKQIKKISIVGIGQSQNDDLTLKESFDTIKLCDFLNF